MCVKTLYGRPIKGGIGMAREGLMDDCGYNFDVDEDSYNSGFKDGFLTAVDEFAEKIKSEIANCSWQFSRLEASTIDKLAEQMKEE